MTALYGQGALPADGTEAPHRYGSSRRAGLIRSPDEIAGLRTAARAAAAALRAASEACIAGAATADIDRAAARAIERSGAEPLFRGYRQGDSPPFPASACVSVNDEAVHGIPGPRRLAPGDLVSIDVGVRVGEWCGDAATSVLVPPAAPEVKSLVALTRDTLAAAAAMMKPGVKWSDVAAFIERRATAHGCAIVTDYIGHGIGRDLHEPPDAPAHVTGWTGGDFTLEAGMVLAVEPIFVRSPRDAARAAELGSARSARSVADAHAASTCSQQQVSGTREYSGFRRAMVKRLPDGWTAVVRGGGLSCHEEHMILVTDTPRGGEILTRP